MTHEAEYHVRIEDGAAPIPPGRAPSFAYMVGGPGDCVHFGSCMTREEAYACALSTLRGMIALERVRKLLR